jgi:hypothetical protein
MGHYCRICCCDKPNEKFTGKGDRTHVCKSCAKLPKAERDTIEHLSEIEGFWAQKNISKKNRVRLQVLVKSENSALAQAAEIMHEVASHFPFKKKRISRINRNRPELFKKLEKIGLINEWNYNYYDENLEEEIEYSSVSIADCESSYDDAKKNRSADETVWEKYGKDIVVWEIGEYRFNPP